ncbi:MAG TPA: hypothetical protein VLQ88_10905 [Chromatiaceae bacterium]|nr:hypothetical protein [Chromatiaceae bacterium]
MRIAGYLVAALLGIAGGWMLFAPTEKAPPPKADPPVAASPPVRPWTPPPAPEATWRESAPSIIPTPPGPPEAFTYRPLSEREQQRLKAGGGVLYPREPTGYPAPARDPYRANPGYDFRPPERR